MKSNYSKILIQGGENIAITKIKKLKSGLSKLIDYAMNPSKTTADKIFNDGMKNEEVVFVS